MAEKGKVVDKGICGLFEIDSHYGPKVGHHTAADNLVGKILQFPYALSLFDIYPGPIETPVDFLKFPVFWIPLPNGEDKACAAERGVAAAKRRAMRRQVARKTLGS